MIAQIIIIACLAGIFILGGIGIHNSKKSSSNDNEVENDVENEVEITVDYEVENTAHKYTCGGIQEEK